MQILLFVWSFFVGCVIALLLHIRAGRSLLAFLRNLKSYLGVSSSFLSLPLKQQTEIVRLLPVLGPDGVDKISPHVPKLAPHMKVLVANLPLLREHLEELLPLMGALVPKMDQLVPLLPKLSKQKQDLHYLLEPKVCRTLLKNIDEMDPSDMGTLIDKLPVFAPYLKQMADDGVLDVVLRQSKALMPLVKLTDDPEFVKHLPKVVSHAKELLPYVEFLVPYADDLIEYSDPLLDHLEDLEPYLDQLIELLPLLRGHFKELSENIDALVEKLPTLAPIMADLAVHADKLCPHISKLLPHMEALMEYWDDLQPHLPQLLEEIDILILYIDDLVPQLPYLAPHIGEIVPVISKTVKYTPYLLKDYGGITPYIHHVLSIPGAAQLLPTLGAFAQQWHALIDGKEVPSTPEAGEQTFVGRSGNIPDTPMNNKSEGSNGNNNNLSGATSTPSRNRLKKAPQKVLRGEWEPDDARDFCFLCSATFSWSRRRHHCRVCGKLICGNCSQNLIISEALGEAPVRCCDKCNVEFAKDVSKPQYDVLDYY